MKTKVEILEEIVRKQDELIKSFGNCNCDICEKVNSELASLKSHLEAGEEKRCATCKWFKIGHGRCVWCLRNTPWNYEEFLKTSGYVDKWQPR